MSLMNKKQDKEPKNPFGQNSEIIGDFGTAADWGESILGKVKLGIVSNGAAGTSVTLGMFENGPVS